MIRNYIKIAWRNLGKNKLYTSLNVAGLTFGITCFLLIGLYVFDELTFDQHHDKADRIYRLIEHKKVNGEATVIAAAGYQLAEESKKKIAEVENTARISRPGRANLVNPDNPVNFQETITSANQGLLQVFDFPFVAGDRNTALAEPNSIIITEELAMRLFGQTNVVGKTLLYNFLDAPLKVTGILKDHPNNSTFVFNNVISETTIGHTGEQLGTDWLSNDFTVYTLLKPNANPGIVAQKMQRLVLDNFKPDIGTTFSFNLQPLKDIHLKSESIVEGGKNSNVEDVAQGNPLYIKIFSFVALFILLIAAINYMNLTTARASSRLKEIGIRKTVGAFKSHLIKQFLLESLLVTIISFVLALICVNLLLPALNSFVNKQLSLGFSTDYRIWLTAIALVIVLGLLSGSYPALMLSRLNPVLLLKGLKVPIKGDLSLRKGLVVFQFTISIIMIIATIILFMQVRYLNSADLGFNKDLLVVIDVNTGKARSEFQTIKTEIAKIPAVKNVSVTSRVPGEWKLYRTIKIKNTGTGDEHRVAYMFGADKDFIKTYEVKLLNGRNFDTPNDSASIIVNETAARLLSITEASGQIVEIPSFSSGNGNFQSIDSTTIPFKPRVIGIVKDFHFQSLRDKIEPLVLAYNKNPIQPIDYYTAKIEATNVQGTLDKLKTVFVNVDKEEPFEYHFLDEQLARFYVEDQRRQTLLIWIALATIFIACLGLFGLATYSARQRMKEIGVRKVLGATLLNITSLLSKDFLKLVLIANVIAFPIALWAMNKWLQEYAYHIDVAWWVFALAAALALAIALLTVSYQAVKAAFANPVKSLRTE
jgi:putative ABC transport system permease protein